MVIGTRFSRYWLSALLGLSAFTLAVWAVVNYRAEFQNPTPPARSFTITGGAAMAQRLQIARLLVREARTRGVELRIEESAGSIDSAQRVQSGAIDFALLQGGLDYGEFPRLRQVATLHAEALHLLVKKSMIPAGDPDQFRLSMLVGKTVNVGGIGAGTHTLALEILDYAGLRPGVDYQLADYSLSELLQGKKVPPPDAVFLVSMIHSPTVRDLVQRQDYLVIPLPFAEAFSMDDLDFQSEQLVDSSLPKVKRRFLVPTVIPPYAYDIEPPVPARALPTVGMRLILATNDSTQPIVVDRLIQAVYNSGFSQAVRPHLTDQLMDLPPEIPWHAAALEYKERNKALITADAIDLVEKEFSILGAVLSITGTLALAYFSLRQWIRQWSRRRRSLRFETYIARVVEIERHVLALELDRSTSLDPLLDLQRQLGQLKAEALERFVNGEIEGEDLLLGFLAQVNDARDYVTRLILHERDNLEDQQERGRLERFLSPYRESIPPDIAVDTTVAEPNTPPEVRDKSP